MAKAVCALLIILALGTASAQVDVKAALKSKGLNSAAALFEAAGVHELAGKPDATWTAFVPTDAAVATFLKDMGLTMDDLASRPGLVREIVGVHLVLRHNVRADELFAMGDVRIVNTAAGLNNNLLFARKDGKVTVTARQGVVANVDSKYIALDAEKTVHVIDAVLMGDGYYTSFAALCSDRGATLYNFCEAVAYSGLAPTINQGFDRTVFAPNNAAFVAAKINLGAGKIPTMTAVADILKLHVLDGAAKELPVPAGEYATLAGPKVKITYESDMRQGIAVSKAFVNGVFVVKPNVYVSKTIVNGIGSVLTAGGAAAAGARPAAPAAMAAPAAAVDAPAATAAASAAMPAAKSSPGPSVTSSGSGFKVTLPHGITVSKAGRRMLAFGWGADAGSTANEDQTETAIQNAVNGNGSARRAATVATQGSEMLSVPGDWNQADEGVNPW